MIWWVVGVIVVFYILRLISGENPIEALIAMIIFTVVVVVILMAFAYWLDRKKEKDTREMMERVKAAVELYYTDNQTLRYDGDLLELLKTSVNAKTGAPYLSQERTYDAWGRAIEYSIENKEKSSYVLRSHGSDEGDAEDDIVIRGTVEFIEVGSQ
jgi:type II secretory pathway pseudopilin PulG